MRSRIAVLDRVLSALRRLVVRNLTGRSPTTKTCFFRPLVSSESPTTSAKSPRWRIPSPPFQDESLNSAMRLFVSRS
jgi:hypothetical protein